MTRDLIAEISAAAKALDEADQAVKTAEAVRLDAEIRLLALQKEHRDERLAGDALLPQVIIRCGEEYWQHVLVKQTANTVFTRILGGNPALPPQQWRRDRRTNEWLQYPKSGRRYGWRSILHPHSTTAAGGREIVRLNTVLHLPLTQAKDDGNE